MKHRHRRPIPFPDCSPCTNPGVYKALLAPACPHCNFPTTTHRPPHFINRDDELYRSPLSSPHGSIQWSSALIRYQLASTRTPLPLHGLATTIPSGAGRVHSFTELHCPVHSTVDDVTLGPWQDEVGSEKKTIC
jgi:hypothetical protein